jgi:hypothetical protein
MDWAKIKRAEKLWHSMCKVIYDTFRDLQEKMEIYGRWIRHGEAQYWNSLWFSMLDKIFTPTLPATFMVQHKIHI